MRNYLARLGAAQAVSVMSGQTLAEDVGVRELAEAAWAIRWRPAPTAA